MNSLFKIEWRPDDFYSERRKSKHIHENFQYDHGQDKSTRNDDNPQPGVGLFFLGFHCTLFRLLNIISPLTPRHLELNIQPAMQLQKTVVVMTTDRKRQAFFLQERLFYQFRTKNSTNKNRDSINFTFLEKVF
jgi:hypothetical protein